MQGDMIGLIALNLVLRVIRAGVMDVALVGHIHSVHPHYPAGDPACLGIPAHAIADFEHSRHDASQPEAGQRLVKYLIQMDGVSRGDEAPRSFYCRSVSRRVRRRITAFAELPMVSASESAPSRWPPRNLSGDDSLLSIAHGGLRRCCKHGSGRLRDFGLMVGRVRMSPTQPTQWLHSLRRHRISFCEFCRNK